MKRNILLALAIFVFYPGFTQNTVGVQLNTSNSLNGYTLFSPRTSQTPRYTYLMDNCGEIVNQWESQFPLFSTDLLMPDGSLYRSVVDNQSTLDLPGNTGRIEHLDWDGNLLWGLTYSDTDFSFHHDFAVLPNGNILMLVAHRRSEAEAIAEGRDPLTIENGELYEESVIEIEPVGTDGFNIVWEWYSWDHLIQDFDNTQNNFGLVEDHPELVDINFGTSFGEADWWHSNSMSYSPALDQITISNRNLDEFIIIDHSTTTAEAATSSGGNSNMGGDLLYRWGNPQSYRQGTPGDQVLFGMHDVHFIPEGSPDAGKIMIFNNGDDIGFTAIQIMTPPYDPNTQNYPYAGGAYGPSDLDYEYVDPIDPTNFFASFLSGSQQLPNGNVLICNGPFGRLFEVDLNDNRVWEYQSPVSNSGILSDGDDPSSEQVRVFRALRYPTDYPAFDGRDLTPIGPIENNPVNDDCILDVTDFSDELQLSVYPTLVDNTFTVETSISSFQLSIYNIQGQVIQQLNSQKTVDVSYLNTGMYFVELTSSNRRSVVKIIKR